MVYKLYTHNVLTYIYTLLLIIIHLNFILHVVMSHVDPSIVEHLIAGS